MSYGPPRLDERTVSYETAEAIQSSPPEIQRAEYQRRTGVTLAYSYYASASWQGVISERYYPRSKWPRTDSEKVERMTRFMDWKVEQMRRRRERTLWAWAGFAALSVATPVFIAVLSYAWRAAVHSIFE